MTSTGTISSSDMKSNYTFSTPHKHGTSVNGTKDLAINSDVKTVSTVSIESPFLSPSPTSSSPPPSTNQRANLTTPVVDMHFLPQIKNISPDPSPVVPRKKATPNLIPLYVKKPNIHQKQLKTCDQGTVPVNRVLQLMVNSTDRIFNDAQNDLNKELRREYPTPTSTYSDDEEEQVCKEISKLQESERSCQHEVNFAIGKIAYRHSSTTQWAQDCDLVHIEDESYKKTESKMNHNDEDFDKDFFDRFCEIFCCNHTYDVKTEKEK